MNIEQNMSSDLLYQKKAILPPEYISEFHRYWEEWGKISGNQRPPTPASMDYLIFRLGKIACRPERKILNAPKSISIEGRTGWKSGKTNEGGGGGISS